jgi:hypothetical protein
MFQVLYLVYIFKRWEKPIENLTDFRKKLKREMRWKREEAYEKCGRLDYTSVSDLLNFIHRKVNYNNFIT